jgi:hypothetical protein
MKTCGGEGGGWKHTLTGIDYGMEISSTTGSWNSSDLLCGANTM